MVQGRAVQGRSMQYRVGQVPIGTGYTTLLPFRFLPNTFLLPTRHDKFSPDVIMSQNDRRDCACQITRFVLATG
jgi:hypothetical protein